MARKAQSRSHPAIDDGRMPSVRIVGGRLRGRKLPYDGSMRTRPMKDRVREAVFNLLGPSIVGALAIDLFAGTGALGLEALSRGARHAVFVEQHFPTAAVLRRTLTELDVVKQAEIVAGDAFVWARRTTPSVESPWVVFCSPPYDLFVTRRDDLLGMIESLVVRAAEGSRFVVESDERFDPGLLPLMEDWDVRKYPPAVVALGRRAEPASASSSG
jgi:16S rRNA (guanine966-N2)-methyltransferase